MRTLGIGEPRTWRSRVLLAVLVLGLVGTSGFLGWRSEQRQSSDEARAAAVRAARQAVQDFVSVSAATVDTDLDRVLGEASGDFADEFGRGRAQVKSVVVANRVTSTGRVLEAGVVSSSPTSAVVLVAADATVTNATAPQGQLRHFRIQVSLAKVSTVWRITTLTFVG